MSFKISTSVIATVKFFKINGVSRLKKYKVAAPKSMRNYGNPTLDTCIQPTHIGHMQAGTEYIIHEVGGKLTNVYIYKEKN